MNIFKKMMTLIASVFPILCTSENVVRETPKEDRFRVPLDKQHGKWAEALLKSERRHLYHIYWSLWGPLSSKQSLLVICKILRAFVNRFTAYDKYSVLNREYLTHPIHMILSHKQKIFSKFFSAFLKSRLNFEHIQKKVTFIASVFRKLPTSENVVT